MKKEVVWDALFYKETNDLVLNEELIIPFIDWIFLIINLLWINNFNFFG